ncbi:hypothetical protein [Allopontixanthobacter sp.]|uniref:hypothetical protein n=1 Tax=Allopontixanthobacter sp. TaxID=2906452 RepID=UPI002AB8BE42|nr:hypothetical protein [Allopontixanthobacter sp.]MDZ4308137.1 hypothetical protein [Allopontixanthobacter sp.]
MKMLVAAAVVVGTAFGVPVIAQERQHQHGSEEPSGSSGQAASMEQHRQAMQEMHELMARAKTTADPAERQRLMAEHRAKMHAQMAQMMSGKNAEMMQQHHQHMAMMHEMMAQMAAHHAANQSAENND